MADVDSHSTELSVSCEEGQSDPLRVAAQAGTRLSTPTADLNVSSWDRLIRFKGKNISVVSVNSDVMHAKKSSVMKHIASKKHTKLLRSARKKSIVL